MIENKRNQLIQIELDLFEKLKSICHNNNLLCWACAGTLLGTIRHKGFIPWDDDMDLFLMWPDYKKLMEVAPKECDYPYFFQCLYTEKDAIPSACRLRRSDTTGFTKAEHLNVGPEYNRGIFIDIFPMFNVPDSEEEKSKQKERVIHTWECIRGHDALIQQKRRGYVNKEFELYIPKYLDLCKQKKIDNVEGDITWLKEEHYYACASEHKRTKEVGATSVKCHHPSFMWNTEWFDAFIELPFENTTIMCPSEYDKILQKQYGDWRTPVKGCSSHQMIALDPTTPWKEFLKKQKKGNDYSETTEY